MKKINFGRVLLGGILAGILINISEYLRYDVVMRGEFEAGLQALGKGLPKGAAATTIWTLWGSASGSRRSGSTPRSVALRSGSRHGRCARASPCGS